MDERVTIQTEAQLASVAEIEKAARAALANVHDAHADSLETQASLAATSELARFAERGGLEGLLTVLQTMCEALAFADLLVERDFGRARGDLLDVVFAALVDNYRSWIDRREGDTP